MVKTRQGRKRTSPNPLDDEDSDLEEKKPKLNTPTEKKSKYFKKRNLNNDEPEFKNKPTPTVSNSITSLAVTTKSEEALKLKSESDTDESSSDEFLKVPMSLNDLGGFETLDKTSDNSFKGNKVGFDSVSSRLSDDSGEDTNIAGQDYFDFSEIIQSQELLINTRKELEEANCKENHANAISNIKKVKRNPKKEIKSRNAKKTFQKPVDEQLEISELLALAEGPMFSHQSSDDSSGDENESVPVEEEYSVPEEGVQVTIELPNLQQKKKSKGFDVEAAMKRRINLIRKENQVFMHQVHTLCWIAHGFYLNRTINSDDVMGLALSLIPSKHCYPSKHADLNYLEKLVEWFIGKVIVDKDHKLAVNSSNLPLKDILETEINSKKAFSIRDLVLIFICMVRSLGIDARLIVSLRPVPLRPPASDLCTVGNSKSEKSSPDKKQSASSSNISDKAEGRKSVGCSTSSNKTNEQSQLKTSNNKNSKQTKSNSTKSKEGAEISLTGSKQVTKIKSPYFSSPDKVKSTEMKSRASLRRNRCAEELEIITNKTPSKKSVNSKTSPSNNNTSRSKSLGNIQGSSNSTNAKKESCKQIKRLSNNLIVDSDNLQQSKEIEERQTKLRKQRRSATSSYQEVNTSSEDEVEIPKPSKKKVNSPEKLKRINAKLAHKNENPQTNKDGNSDSDFEPKKLTLEKKSIDRRVLSSDDENGKSKKVGNDFWAEVFLEAEEKWISVDLSRPKGNIHCIHKLYNGATQPVRYVIAFNGDGSAKDVTRRYAPQWLTVTRRLRANDKWWRDTMKPYAPHQSFRERDEDEDLDRQLHDKPLPTTITEYKNHPLYALRRNLLKFEAIYPPDAPPLGFVRGEPVYSRGCVTDLHTRETWIKEAKLVRRGEEPYKIVKARPKWDKVSQKVINDLPLPLFGHWQVEDYIPPPAVDGKVPRNEYGNVELYKPCMLPPGTVHLQVPQLARVARKLGIDCAPAVVGWEFSGGSSHPVLDGFIVCEEVKEVLLDAWNKEMDESAIRAKEKFEKRVYGNWKRLIKGLLIRERLKLRYDFGEPEPEKKKKQQSKPSTSKS